ncbi:MAG: hypothetical protein ACI8UR_000078 [Natronomonas sp.]|jgi:hypothetical protein|uniref:hypothetical protein n=1 Tax=Natronomonas sp. TaxID=2184060 RepID=UPI0039896BB5
MYYWFRPPVHFCESADAERALCGTKITGLSPTIREVSEDEDPLELFEDRDVSVCNNCRRVVTARAKRESE